MNKYLIIFEKSKTGFSAYSPDLPGCVASGKTKVETEKLMKEAIEFHLEGMIEEGMEIPKSSIRDVEFFKFDYRSKIGNLVTA